MRAYRDNRRRPARYPGTGRRAYVLLWYSRTSPESGRTIASGCAMLNEQRYLRVLSEVLISLCAPSALAGKAAQSPSDIDTSSLLTWSVPDLPARRWPPR